MRPFGDEDKCLWLDASSRDLVDLCLRRDADLNRLLSGTRIFAADLDGREHRIACRDWLALVKNCRRQVPVEDLAFLAADAILANPGHGFFQLLQSAPDLGRALRIWHYYRCHFLPLMQVGLHAGSRGLAIHLLPAVGLQRQEVFVTELLVSLLLGLIRHQLDDWEGIAIELGYAKPPDAEVYRQHWPLMPEFSAPLSRVLIPYPLLHKPFAERDAERFRELLHCYRQRTRGVKRQVGLLEFLRRRQRRALPAGLGLEEAAAELAMSPSSLKRWLHRQGTNYGRLGDEARSDLAFSLLCDHHWSNPRIARHLGYANEHNFRRAFKRWTGLQPSAFR